MNNIFELPNQVPKEEVFEKILSGENIVIERIISYGQSSPEGFWYDQEKDEWIVLLQGEAVLLYENGDKINLKPGDYVFIPKHKKHRVEKTGSNPPCIWLAMHGSLTLK